MKLVFIVSTLVFMFGNAILLNVTSIPFETNIPLDMEYINSLYAPLNETISNRMMNSTSLLLEDLNFKYERLKNRYRIEGTNDELENFWAGGRGSRYEAWVAMYKIADIPQIGPLVHAAIKFKREGELIDQGEVDCGWGKDGYEMCVDKREPIDTIFIGSTTEQPNSVDAQTVYEIVKEVRRDWEGKSYNMLEDNCTDFVYEILKRLGLHNVLGMFIIYACNYVLYNCNCYAYSRTYQ